MSLEIKIPNVAESITEVTIAQWLKKDGEFVNRDEALCEVETDKATQELFSEEAGILKIMTPAGETVAVGAVIGKIESNGQTSAQPTQITQNEVLSPSPVPAATPSGEVVEMVVTPIAESITEVVVGSWLVNEGDYVELDQPLCEIETDKATQEMPSTASGIIHIVAPAGSTLKIGDLICKIAVGQKSASTTPQSQPTASQTTQVTTQSENKETYATGTPSPAATKILAEKGIEAKEVQGSGKDGRITKEDALKAEKTVKTTDNSSQTASKATQSVDNQPIGERGQRRVRMTQLRKTISRRLVAVKNETAMLTTFNEVNMKPIMDLRAKYKDEFKEKHGVGLGFMSFFAKACANALLQIPEVNAMIDGTDIVYNDFVDISVAVSAPKGLVVPVLRNVENMNFAGIEKGIVDLATKAKNNTLTIEDMTGGTFTITNGGIFGSMMSTPIINAPQSAILGMHNIVERPMAVNGEVKILPMMYLALSYDHRIIDGREAVTFLVTVKKYLENPERLLLDL
ncbi:MAG: 2-oxoglutarate dehydrogenase complex dihydrolipoyllysine-residue succinyltransferase [Microscillaceae bacterium]|jgi:2-oxoglutarate dehydrogenase E2 component (dihydrolipoamide succinyltransferase)|nr:2-oxoglutarate dehydrogenase complex dihydrolipoyllysine-residue succinyltransferase [Microscillaceae bacterium]